MTVARLRDLLQSVPDEIEIEIVRVSEKFISSSEVEKLGVSRQLLRYYVKNFYVKTIPHGKQKRYRLSDILDILD